MKNRELKVLSFQIECRWKQIRFGRKLFSHMVRCRHQYSNTLLLRCDAILSKWCDKVVLDQVKYAALAGIERPSAARLQAACSGK